MKVRRDELSVTDRPLVIITSKRVRERELLWMVMLLTNYHLSTELSMLLRHHEPPHGGGGGGGYIHEAVTWYHSHH